MKIHKKTILRFFLVIEIAIFIGVYLFGGNGLPCLSRLKNDNKKLHAELLALKKEIVHIEKETGDWQSHDFYKEKYARERLQMVKKDDEIYFLR